MFMLSYLIWMKAQRITTLQLQTPPLLKMGVVSFFLDTEKTVKIVIYAKMQEPETIVWDNKNNYSQYVASSEIATVTSHHIFSLHAASGWEGTRANGSYTGAQRRTFRYP